MSHRDQSDRMLNDRDVPDRAAGSPRAPHGVGVRPPAAPRPTEVGPAQAGAAPWPTADPADIDRYLDERAQAVPRGQSAGIPTPPRSSGRAAPAGMAGRVPADDPTDPAQWEEVADETDRTPRATGPDPTDPRGAPARVGRTGSRARPRAGHPRAAPTLPKPRVPAFITGADLVQDPVALALLGVAGFGVAVMAALLSNQLGDLPATIAIHLDPAGIPDRWASRGDLWRIPLLVTMTTLMNLVVAWFLSPHDRFASRFMLAASLVVQLIGWIAIFDFI